MVSNFPQCQLLNINQHNTDDSFSVLCNNLLLSPIVTLHTHTLHTMHTLLFPIALTEYTRRLTVS